MEKCELTQSLTLDLSKVEGLQSQFEEIAHFVQRAAGLFDASSPSADGKSKLPPELRTALGDIYNSCMRAAFSVHIYCDNLVTIKREISKYSEK